MSTSTLVLVDAPFPFIFALLNSPLLFLLINTYSLQLWLDLMEPENQLSWSLCAVISCPLKAWSSGTIISPSVAIISIQWSNWIWAWLPWSIFETRFLSSVLGCAILILESRRFRMLKKTYKSGVHWLGGTEYPATCSYSKYLHWAMVNSQGLVSSNRMLVSVFTGYSFCGTGNAASTPSLAWWTYQSLGYGVHRQSCQCNQQFQWFISPLFLFSISPLSVSL